MQSLFKNLIIIIGLGSLLAIGYYLFVIQSDSTIAPDSSVSAVDLETQNFLRKLQKISSLSLSRDLFADPKFDSLVEFTLPIEAVSVGRENPFLQ